MACTNLVELREGSRALCIVSKVSLRDFAINKDLFIPLYIQMCESVMYVSSKCMHLI